jgi:Yip1 domain
MATNPSVPSQPPPPSQSTQETAPLSEGQRLAYTFFSPSKTFTDLRRNASWWAPFLIMAIISLMFVYVVDQKVGFRKVAENQIQSQPKQADRIEHMPADQREKVMQQQVTVTKIISYAFVVLLLVWFAIIAAVLLATLKFGAGADVKFKTLFALCIYASLPGLLKSLLAILSLLAGVSSDGFTFQNPVATNPGYFIDPVASPVLYGLLTKFDIFTIWTLVLTAIGITCISKVKSGTAFAVVFGWFFFLVLVGVGFSAAFS